MERRELTAPDGARSRSDVPKSDHAIYDICHAHAVIHAVGKQESVLNALRLPTPVLSAMYDTSSTCRCRISPAS